MTQTAHRFDDFVLQHETAKAFLFADGEVEFWTQKRWVRKDGTLTAAAIKAYEEAVEAAERDNEPVELPPISWSNAGCVAFDLTLHFETAGVGHKRPGRARVFIDRSLLDDDGHARRGDIDAAVNKAVDRALDQLPRFGSNRPYAAEAICADGYDWL